MRTDLSRCRILLLLVLLTFSSVQTALAGEGVPRRYYATSVEIPMRDGVQLTANLVTPGHGKPAPVIVSITPYGRHPLHPIGAAYAQMGFAYLAVDTRGRGDSGGVEAVFKGDLTDSLDVVSWASKQSFSDGQVAMRGASYGGFNQWMAAAKGAPALKTITPAAAVYPGLDFPMTYNVGLPYMTIWTGFTKGRMANFGLFGDATYWREAFTDALEQGVPFVDLDEFVGLKRDLFDEWASHAYLDDYWRNLNPTDEEMAAIDMPILSVTGLFDGAQPGALEYYRQHMANASAEAKAKHYLVIGPYDHGGVTVPSARVAGIDVPQAGGINPVVLYGQWTAWHLLNAPRPEFLKDRVMYYVLGANEWRAAPSLEAIPVERRVFYLQGDNPTALDRAGLLSPAIPDSSTVSYRFDPLDTRKAGLGSWFEGDYALYDADVQAIDGDGFVFDTVPFEHAVEFIGQPRFEAMIGIDTPDADFRLRVFGITPSGQSLFLSYLHGRARYREGLDQPVLIGSAEPRPYVFDPFIFAAQRLEAGSRLRFVLDPPNSIYYQRNYNAAGPVELQTREDAVTSTITMLLGGKDGARLMLPLRKVDSVE